MRGRISTRGGLSVGQTVARSNQAALARWARQNGLVTGSELNAAVPPSAEETYDTPETVAEKATRGRKVFEMARRTL